MRLLRDACPTLSVGVLSADLMSLGAQLAALQAAGVRVAHVDVMDGRFVPMLTVGPAFVKALRTPLLKDVHLMIAEPLATVEQYVAAGADIITVHIESSRHPHRVLERLGEMADPQRGIVRGIAVNPGTPLSAIEPLLSEAEMIVLLAVNPGWSGQKFIPATVEGIAAAKRMIAACGHDVLLCVDGGITRDNVAQIAALGVDLIVTGSAVFAEGRIADNARFMLDACRAARQS